MYKAYVCGESERTRMNAKIVKIWYAAKECVYIGEREDETKQLVKLYISHRYGRNVCGCVSLCLHRIYRIHIVVIAATTKTTTTIKEWFLCPFFLRFCCTSFCPEREKKIIYILANKLLN